MPPIASPPPQPSDYDVDGPFPELGSSSSHPWRRPSYASVLATPGPSTSTSATPMPVDEEEGGAAAASETWTSEDVDVPAGLSELSGAVLPIRIGGSTAATSTLASDFYATPDPTPSSSTSTPTRRPRSENPLRSPAESLTLDRLLGSPSSIRRSASTGGESSVPDHLRRTSAWRISGPGRAVPATDPLGMSLPNERIDLSREGAPERARPGSDHELPLPWVNGVASAHRAGYYGQEEEAADRARESASAAGYESPISRLQARSAAILELAQRRTNMASSVAIPGGRGMISTGPQQVVPTNSHFSWASYGAGTTSRSNTATPAAVPPREPSAPASTAIPSTANPSTAVPTPSSSSTPSRNDRMATTVVRRRRAETDDAVRNLVERIGRSNDASSRQVYAFDPADIAPPGGTDDHIWNILGMPDSDDDDDIARWGTYRAADILRAGRGAPSGSQSHMDLDAWGTPPESGASLTRGRFNRRRRSSVRHEEIPTTQDVVMSESPVRRFPPTNTGAQQEPVYVSDERSRRRRESDTGNGSDSPWPSKRIRRDTPAPDATRPTYASLSSLPATAILPTDFTAPTRDSWLELTTKEINGVTRPVVTFVLNRAAPMAIEDTESDACALRANVPIPHDIGVHYYEVEVLERAEGYLTVGWMQDHVNLNRLVGWDQGSWGWHGDDGQTFEGKGDGNDFGDAWGSGDTVGCGVDYTTGRAFFTLNGRLVGHVFSKLPPGLHPAVGLRSPGESLAINFTGPFIYDIDSHVKTIRERIRSTLHPAREVFSAVPKRTTVPRLAGLPTRTTPQPLSKPSLPADSPLQDGASRAAAAFVLDHLVTAGHGKIAASMQRDMQKRGWITPGETTDHSQAAAVAAVARALREGKVQWDEMRALDAGVGGAWAHLERRLSIYAFAQSALAGEDAVAQGRELRRRAKEEKWVKTDVELVDCAASALVGVEDGLLVKAREKDADELEKVLREAQGLKLRSCLHMAVAQTQLVHEVLVGRGDGEAAFLGLDAVL